ncbi:DAK2 domain-containing protein [Streptomyces sp. AJS327]|uniref:DAK2 domain-containing protein n=1 Tax=Streptomyces sp. AJS327 TaxID=2545265 RepID=UPI0015DF7D9C|nr:DAK2 domain-containing protein [Streptomyces sp. AJS327]MBA0051785.1 DAK2 domain-containing protein [Streptomyces sp. AJS327]
MPRPLDPAAIRRWCALALEALRADRAELDAINVFPVPDGDTGTNLWHTLDAAVRAVDESRRETPHDSPDGKPDGQASRPAGAGEAVTLLRTLARGALLGACGNSGTILAQYLGGFAEGLARTASGGESGGEDEPAANPRNTGAASGAEGRDPAGEALCRALRSAAEAAYEAVARPAEGTVLTVAAAAAEAAGRTGGGPPEVALAARRGAERALLETPARLPVLAEAGVVDAGGRGLTAVLGALAEALGAPPPEEPPAAPARCPGARPGGPLPGQGGPPAGHFEVMYLLDAEESALPALRARLDALGDSLAVAGGGGTWSVHLHTGDAGAAVEAGIAAGRPHRIRVSGLPGPPPEAPDAATAPSTVPGAERRPSPGAPPSAAPARLAAAPAPRAVVSVVAGEGLAALCAEAGARPVPAEAARADSGAEALYEAVRGTGAREVVLLPNDTALREAAARAAARARSGGVRISVIPTRAAVQGVAALAVHEPGLSFDEDVVAMTAAAGATRYGEVTVAEHRSWTMAGVCAAGDVLGLVDGDVALIGESVERAALGVLTRMLAAGGELVTLVTGAGAPCGMTERLEDHVRHRHLGVSTVVCAGGQPHSPLLIGVE